MNLWIIIYFSFHQIVDSNHLPNLCCNYAYLVCIRVLSSDFQSPTFSYLFLRIQFNVKTISQGYDRICDNTPKTINLNFDFPIKKKTWPCVINILTTIPNWDVMTNIRHVRKHSRFIDWTFHTKDGVSYSKLDGKLIGLRSKWLFRTTLNEMDT